MKARTKFSSSKRCKAASVEKLVDRKTKSSAKKRFEITKNGHVKAGQANKRHNMRKRSKRQIRNQRGTTILPHMEEVRILKNYMPYAGV